MKLTRYLLPVILLTVLSTEAFAQDPSAKDAFAAFCKRKAEVYCQDIELSDVRVGKQLQNQLGKYWPVRAKEMYRKKKSGAGRPARLRRSNGRFTRMGLEDMNINRSSCYNSHLTDAPQRGGI